VRHGVAGHADLEAAHVGVERAVEDALLGDLAAEHDVVDPALVQHVLERRPVEDAVPRLDHERRRVGR
jgi:hypothetical protein